MRTSGRYTASGGGTKKVDIGRHSAFCTICKHPQRAEIERKFLTWVGPAAIAKEYGLGDRVTVYRHGVAFGLYDKRQRTVRKALEKVSGVQKVKATLEPPEAVVTFDDAKTSLEKLTEATERAGYPSSVKSGK